MCPSHETVETMSTKTVSRESRDVADLLSFYTAQDGSSNSSEPLHKDKFFFLISDKSQDLFEFKKHHCYI